MNQARGGWPGLGLWACIALALGCEAGPDAPVPESPDGPDETLGSGVAALGAREPYAARLTPRQYQHALQDVLGVTLQGPELDPARWGIPRAKNSTGLFSNSADGQPASDDYALAFGKLAAAVAARVDAELLMTDASLSELQRLLYRRPLTPLESERLAQLEAELVAQGVTPEQAKRGVLEAVLQSPAFLFRLEREQGDGSERYLDGDELAARLAFFVWESVPDALLLDAAQSGELNGTDEALPQLRAQLARMLEDPKAERLLAGFVTDFAETERAAFVGMTPELRDAMLTSLIATVEHHLWGSGRPLEELFTLSEMVLDPLTAEWIGLSPTEPGLTLYDVSELPQRVGWLSHPGFIAGIGEVEVGNVVTRGISLMVKLMCRQPLEVPAAVQPAVNSFNAEFANLTQRQRSEQRQLMALPESQGGQNNGVCWGCHSQFEPLAYGFDRFDAAGRYLGERDALGRALPIDGWMTDDLSLPEGDRPRYADMYEFMRLMEQSEVVQACLVEHFLAFGTGRAAASLEKQYSHQVNEVRSRTGGDLTALLEAVVTSELFRKSKTMQAESQ